MDKINEKTRPKRAKWWSEKGADKLVGVHCTPGAQKNESRWESFFGRREAGGLTGRAPMMMMMPRALFMPIVFFFKLRQPTGSLTPLISQLPLYNNAFNGLNKRQETSKNK
jgi:hypothetical protein